MFRHLEDVTKYTREQYLSVNYDVNFAVAQLVEGLRNKPEGRGFDYRKYHRNFSLTYSFRPQYDPDVESASNVNEYQEYLRGGKGGRCVGLTTWEPQPQDL
jgi:hypothetical protein